MYEDSLRSNHFGPDKFGNENFVILGNSYFLFRNTGNAFKAIIFYLRILGNKHNV